MKGTGFSPYVNSSKISRALAPEGHFIVKLTHYKLAHYPVADRRCVAGVIPCTLKNSEVPKCEVTK